MKNYCAFRGTNEFAIYISNDASNSNLAVQSSLQNVNNLNWLIPLERFPITPPIQGRFIKFAVLSHFGVSGGLQYITWNDIVPPAPGNTLGTGFILEPGKFLQSPTKNVEGKTMFY